MLAIADALPLSLGEKAQKHFHTAAPLGRQYESAFAPCWGHTTYVSVGRQKNFDAGDDRDLFPADLIGGALICRFRAGTDAHLRRQHDGVPAPRAAHDHVDRYGEDDFIRKPVVDAPLHFRAQKGQLAYSVAEPIAVAVEPQMKAPGISCGERDAVKTFKVIVSALLRNGKENISSGIASDIVLETHIVYGILGCFRSFGLKGGDRGRERRDGQTRAQDQGQGLGGMTCGGVSASFGAAVSGLASSGLSPSGLASSGLVSSGFPSAAWASSSGGDWESPFTRASTGTPSSFPILSKFSVEGADTPCSHLDTACLDMSSAPARLHLGHALLFPQERQPFSKTHIAGPP